jgi:hypothetical protein
LDLFWSISEALLNRISAMIMPFYWLCSFGSILKHFWSIFQSRLCKEGHVYAFLLTMQLWIYSEAFLKHFSITSLQRRTCTVQAILSTMHLWIYSKAFLKHFSITSLQRRTCTGFSINYATLDLFWSISEALFNHVSASPSLQRCDWKVPQKCFRIDQKLQS